MEFQESIGDATELSFPVYGFMDQTRYAENLGFVPFVQSPGVALIVIGDEEGTAALVLIRSLALCWPILFLSVILLWAFGVLLWFLVRILGDLCRQSLIHVYKCLAIYVAIWQ